MHVLIPIFSGGHAILIWLFLPEKDGSGGLKFIMNFQNFLRVFPVIFGDKEGVSIMCPPSFKHHSEPCTALLG